MSTIDPRLLNDCVFVPFASLPRPAAPRSHHVPQLVDLPSVARAHHIRRKLERAAEHGTALLLALGLPRLVDTEFVEVDPEALGDALDMVVAQLDNFDAPQEDLEECDDLEKVGDDELCLGWPAAHSQIRLGNNTDYGDHTAPERHGRGFLRCGSDRGRLPRRLWRDCLMLELDIAAVVRLARAAADELVFRAEDPGSDLDLTRAERRALLTIAAAVDAEVSRWAGLEPRSAEAQAVIDKALAAVLP